MSAGGVAIPPAAARAIYQGLVEGFEDWAGLRCRVDRIELAGSARRGVTGHDLDIVAIPRAVEGPGQARMFGGEHDVVNGVWLSLDQLLPSGRAQILCPTKTWAEKAKMGAAKKLQVRLPGALAGCGVKVEIDLVSAETWGSWLMVRTGCAEFSKAVMQRARNLDLRFASGFKLLSGRTALDTSEEELVFGHLDMRYVEPTDRTSYSAVAAHSILGPVYPGTPDDERDPD